MKRNILMLSVTACLVAGLLTGCGKKLTEKVTQKETKVKVGANVNLKDLFSCEEGITIGFKNADAFDSKKVGSYSLETTITDGDEEAEKTYIVEVYDDEAPVITIKNKEIKVYEKDKIDAKSYVDCTDNSGEKIEVQVDDSAVNMAKSGEYPIKYTATDSSGNTSEAETKITVKPTFTYKKLKTLVNSIIKKGKYTKLELKTYKNYNEIALNIHLSGDEKKEYISIGDTLAVDMYVKNKKIVPQLFCAVGEIDTSKYLRAESMHIESKNGVIISDEHENANYDYDYGYVYPYSSTIGFYFTKLESLEKFCSIVKGSNLTTTVYTDKRTLKHKCTKSDIKKLKQLGKFYEELLKSM